MRIALLALALLAWAKPAWAHDWYTGLRNASGESCCGGSDCHPVATSEARQEADGTLSVLWDGKWYVVPDEAILVDAYSPDGRLHLCFWGGKVKCLILPAAL